MPRFVTATKNDKPKKKYVRTSINHIKAELKKHPDTEWEVKHYDQKTDLTNLCKMLQSMKKVEATDEYVIKVTSTGICRKV